MPGSSSLGKFRLKEWKNLIRRYKFSTYATKVSVRDHKSKDFIRHMVETINKLRLQEFAKRTGMPVESAVKDFEDFPGAGIFMSSFYPGR